MTNKTKQEEKCNHEWIEDELFKSGAVVMLFGNIGDVQRETRVICKKCGMVNYMQVMTGKLALEEAQKQNEPTA